MLWKVRKTSSCFHLSHCSYKQLLLFHTFQSHLIWPWCWIHEHHYDSWSISTRCLYFSTSPLCSVYSSLCCCAGEIQHHVCGWLPDVSIYLPVSCTQYACPPLPGWAETERHLVWCDSGSGEQELSSPLLSTGLLQRLFLHQTPKPHGMELGHHSAWGSNHLH